MAEKLCILMLNHEFPPIGGGGGYAGRNILRQFAGRDDIRLDAVLSRPEPGTVVEQFADNITLYRVGVRKKALQFWTRPEMIQWMRKAYRVHKQLIRENRYDLAHAFFGFPTGMLTWRTASKLPYIISLRGSDVPGVNVRFSLDYKILGPLFRRIWSRADGLYACSSGLRARAGRFLPDVEIGVVPNGVEPDRFRPRAKTSHPEQPRLLTVGRLSVSKRIDVLVGAVELLRDQCPDVTLTIAGGGGLERKLRELIETRGLADCVRVLGIVPAEEMPQLYRDHDLFVTATAQEGMSNAMLEAMASGLPIITTRCEGVAELIHENGIVLDSAEPEAMARAVATLTGDPNAYSAMSAAARSRAELFSWKNVADEYRQCYERVVHRRAEKDDASCAV